MQKVHYSYDEETQKTVTQTVTALDAKEVEAVIERGYPAAIAIALARPVNDQFDHLEDEWFEIQSAIQDAEPEDDISELLYARELLESGSVTTTKIETTEFGEVESVHTDYAPQRAWCKAYRGVETAIERPENTTHLDNVKRLKKLAIASEMARIASVGVEVDGVLFDSDDRARANITSALMIFSNGVPMPSGFTWRSKDNTDVPMEIGKLKALAGAVMRHIGEVYSRSWAAKDAVMLAATLQEVLNVDI